MAAAASLAAVVEALRQRQHAGWRRWRRQLGGSAAVAVAAWQRWAARWQLGGSGGDGGSTAASAAALPPRAVAVAMKTQAVIVVVGHSYQLTIN